MRPLIRCHHLSFRVHEDVVLPVEIANSLLEQRLDLAMLARDASEGEAASLPQVVVIDLGDRGAEAVLELRLRRLHELALALERARLGEVELDGEDADVAGAHGAYSAVVVAGSGSGVGALRSVRSTCFVS
jgi:hypothetical protein